MHTLWDGRHPEAEDDYLRAVVLARLLDQSEMLAVAQLGLAATLFALGRDAMPLVEQTRALLDGLDHLGFRLDACAGRGLVKLGRVDEGRAYLLRAVAGARAGNAPDVEADALTDLADLDVGAGALGAAVLCLEAAVAALSRTSSDKALEAGVRLAALLLCDGRDDEARATLGPIRQRFGWRLRPAVAAEIALVERALDGDPAGAEPVAEAASGRAAESPALRRLHAVVSERRARV